jgi:hypothetical protein
MDTKLLAEHIVKSNKAMEVLIQGKHHEAALILLYSWVDRLSWLAVDKDESSGSDFKTWLNKYFFTDGHSYDFNVHDLWGARCALLHTGTSEARDVRSGRARAVFYYGGPMEVKAKAHNEQVYINVGKLHVGLVEAATNFEEYLKKQPGELELVNKKLGKVLTRTTKF